MSSHLLPLPSTIHSLSKFGLCLVAALSSSFALFLFMLRLVNPASPTLPDVEYSGFVALLKTVEPEQAEKTTPEPAAPLQEPEPQSSSLSALAQPDTNIRLPNDFEFDGGALLDGLSMGQGSGNIPIASDLLEDFGEDTEQGFIEITPYSTRQPNIPDMAYANQLNGWVLVIFNVSASGKTHNIKVLDASPKGVFEQEVIRAVKRWRYNVTAITGDGRDVIMTQKIDLNWQNYPQNLPYYD